MRNALILTAAMMGLAGGASAQDLSYTPVNPTFGGNPFNSAHLLGVAGAQNGYKDPTSTASQSQAQLFANQLQARLLSSLASQVTEAIFGPNPQEHGIITFGSQTIEFTRGLDAVTLTITETDTGETTTVVVPTLVTGG